MSLIKKWKWHIIKQNYTIILTLNKKVKTKRKAIVRRTMYVPRHESDDQDFGVVLEVGFIVGLLICWVFVLIFLESFVVFILASKVELLPPSFMRKFVERLFFPSNSIVVLNLGPVFPELKPSWWGCWSTSNVSRLGLSDVEQSEWAILSLLFDLQLPSTHLVSN